MSKKRVLLLIILVISFSILLSGCKGKKKKEALDENQTIEYALDEEGNPILDEEVLEGEEGFIIDGEPKELNLRETEQIGYDLVSALSREDYQSILNMLKIEDNGLIDSTYIKRHFMMQDTDFLLGKSVNISNIVVDDSGEIRNFEVFYISEGKERSYKGQVKLIGIEWTLYIDDLFIADWEIIVPRGVSKILLDGVDISKYWIENVGTNSDSYIIPFTSGGEKKLQIETMFGSYEKIITPSKDVDRGVSHTGNASPDAIESAINWYTEALNKIIKHASSGEELSEFKETVFDSTMPVDIVESIYNETKAKHKEKDVEIIKTGIIGDSIVKANDEIYLPVRHTFSWTDANSNKVSMVIKDSVTLRRVKGGYRIIEMMDEGKVLKTLNPLLQEIN